MNGSSCCMFVCCAWMCLPQCLSFFSMCSGAAEIQRRQRGDFWTTWGANSNAGPAQISKRLHASDSHHRIRGQEASAPICVWPIRAWTNTKLSLTPRVSSASWAACWCRVRSVCGSAIKGVPRAWKSWPALSQCRGTCFCTRELCCSASGGRSTEMAATRRHPTASSTVWRLVCVFFCGGATLAHCSWNCLKMLEYLFLIPNAGVFVVAHLLQCSLLLCK